MIAERVSIRRATAADAPALAASRFRFRSAFNASGPLPEPGALEEEAAFLARAVPLIAQHLAGARWFAWIAERDGSLVGHVFMQLVDKLPNPSRHEPERLGYLTSFYVESDLRGLGVGAALMQELELCAAQRDVEKILIVGATPRSRTLYTRRGYQSTPDLLQKVLAQHAHL